MRWKEITVSINPDISDQVGVDHYITEYEKLRPILKHNYYFLYNYAAVLNKLGRYDQSLLIIHSSHMVPCRFLPLYRIFEIYVIVGKYDEARIIAEKIIKKEVKVPSMAILSIRSAIKKYLDDAP